MLRPERIYFHRSSTVYRRLPAALLAAAMAAGGLASCSSGNRDPAPAPTISEDVVTEIPVNVAPSVEAPLPVKDYARDYVARRIERYHEGWSSFAPDSRIREARITGISLMPTGTAGLTESLDLYRLEYRLLVDGDLDKVLVGGVHQEDGWLTERTSLGQPYLLFRQDLNTQLYSHILDTTDSEILGEFGSEEYTLLYEDPYQAAAAELGARWKKERQFEDAALTVLDGVTAAIPHMYDDRLLTVREGGSELLSLWERSSVEQAAADGLEGRGYGWLGSLARYSRSEFEQLLAQGIPGLTWFARDSEDRYYALSQPTDVRIYRSGEVGVHDVRNWSDLTDFCYELSDDLIRRNRLEPYDAKALYSNTTYDGTHQYRTYLSEFGEECLFVFSQPAEQGGSGIWCVDRVLSSYGGVLLWFPDSGKPASDFYEGLQADRNRGLPTDHNTPEEAFRFYRDSSGRFPGLEFDQLVPVEPLPRTEMLLAGITEEKIAAINPGETMTASHLAELLRQASEHPVAGTPIPNCPWSMDIHLTDDTVMTLYSPPEGSVVQIDLARGQLHSTSFFSHKGLYELVRHSSDQPTVIDTEGYKLCESMLVDAMARTLADVSEDPARFTQWEPIRFTPVLTYDDPITGELVTVYDFDFALIPAQPDRVNLTGTMYMDGNQRVLGVNSYGQLAVRTADGAITAAAFLGEAGPVGPDTTDSEPINCRLDQAARNAILTVRADYPTARDLELPHEFYLDGATDYNQQVLFTAQRPVTDFQFFRLDFTGDAESYGPTRGEVLYRQESLTPEQPLIIETSFPGDMPSRGISFVEDGITYAYTLSMSGRDSSLVLYPDKSLTR